MAGPGSFWPLFDLVVRTPRLELRLPREEDFAALVELVDAGSTIRPRCPSSCRGPTSSPAPRPRDRAVAVAEPGRLGAGQMDLHRRRLRRRAARSGSRASAPSTSGPCDRSRPGRGSAAPTKERGRARDARGDPARCLRRARRRGGPERRVRRQRRLPRRVALRGLRGEWRGQGPAPRRVGSHDPLSVGPRRLGAPSPRRHRAPRARVVPHFFVGPTPKGGPPTALRLGTATRRRSPLPNVLLCSKTGSTGLVAP